MRSATTAPNYLQIFLTAAVSELPKIATVLLTVVLTAALAWWVTAGLTARWDIRKKRQEFDLVLVKEFYELIGSFKSVAREAEALGPRPRPASPAVIPDQPGAEAAALRANWETKQAPLAQRALETEMKMEAILLKLISEGPSDEGMGTAEWRRQRQAAGLLRTAFRNLRETVERGTMRLPGFDSPELWLFNRLAGEISKIFYTRSARSPKKPESAAPTLDATDYLRLVVYRTGDIEAAVARISPKVASFTQRRHEARQSARRARVHSAFDQDACVLVSQLPATPQQSDPTLPATARVAVELADQEVTDHTAALVAERLFGSNRDLKFYLVLADRPPRVVAVCSDGAIANYTAAQRARSYVDTSPGDATLDRMEIRLAPDQEAHLAALAASAGRSAAELVQEALAEWEERQAERHAPARPQHTPAEAAARILELRKGNILSAGATIKDLINHGRA